DRTLDRTTTGKGALADADAGAVGRLDAGAWFGKPFAGAAVPTLDAALAAMGGTSHAYLDCKDITPEALARVMRDRKILDRSAVYQSVGYLRRLKAVEPAARGMASFRTLAEFDAIADLQPYAVDASWGLLSKDLVDRCHARGIRVFSDALGLHETVAD